MLTRYNFVTLQRNIKENRMATIKQQTALEKIVENGGNVTQAMRDARYSESTVNNPSNLTKSKGYKHLLDECGLNEDLIVRSLVEDIKEKKGRRLGEISLGAEILGMRKMGIFIANKTMSDEEANKNEKNDKEEAMLEKLEYLYDSYSKAKMQGETSFTIKMPF